MRELFFQRVCDRHFDDVGGMQEWCWQEPTWLTTVGIAAYFGLVILGALIVVGAAFAKFR